MLSCCCRKKKNSSHKSSSTRSHQPLCKKDSGTVNVHVKRVAGAPLLRNHSKDSDTSSAYGGSSPGVYNEASSPHRAGSANPLLRNKAVYRASPMPDRFGSGGRVSGVHNTGSMRSTQHLRDSVRNSALESAICRFGRRFDEDERTLPKESTMKDSPKNHPKNHPKNRDSGTLGGGFTLSSSFEGGLDKIETLTIVQDSKKSSYDNLNVTDEDEFERKHSLYDNVDDDAQQPLVNREQSYRQNLSDDPSLSQASRRRSSKNMPLHFTMFNGGQHSRVCDDSGGEDDDRDYVNIPPLSRDSQRQRPGFRPKVNQPTNLAPKSGVTTSGEKATQLKPNTQQEEDTSAQGKKKRYRRGSKTLKLFCSRKAPILSKIEKQVLAYVPIIGEPTPEPVQNNPLNDFDFPPPPEESPPKVPTVVVPVTGSLQTCHNPSYAPNTATPGCDLDTGNPFSKPNAYFSF